jgi:hypothetical protein
MPSFLFVPLRLCDFASRGAGVLVASMMTTSFALAASAPLGFDDARHLINRTSSAAGLGAMRSCSRRSRKAWLP